MKRMPPSRRVELGRRALELASSCALEASGRAAVLQFRLDNLWERDEMGQLVGSGPRLLVDERAAEGWLRVRDCIDDAAVDVIDLLLDPSAFAEALGHPLHRPPPTTPGPLHSLRSVVEDLVREFPWSMRDATLFVLTGAEPAVRLVRTIRGGPYFVMIVDESLTTSEVGSLFERRHFADDGYSSVGTFRRDRADARSGRLSRDR
jgi:hypothetical protein